MAQPYGYTSHEGFSHDSIDSLGYDWERIANPGIAPKFPAKIYLPLTSAEVVQAVQETRKLGQRLVIRSKGHSSNDLVLVDRGAVLCVEKLNQILHLDEERGTVTVQSGIVLSDLDQYLSTRGLGLPIIGDHNHITAGGFASVGGISPASHRFGMFLDNVRRLEYVTPEGELATCGRDDHPEAFYRVLAGLGQHGVIVTLTLDVIKIDKLKYILENDRRLFLRMEEFIAESQRRIEHPGEAKMERGLWLDLPVAGRSIRVGQFSSYYETAQSRTKSLRNQVSYRALHTLGHWAGRLPSALDLLVKYVGMAGVVLSPRYASYKNIETFTDRILDSSVGDPTRMFIVLAPVDRFSRLFKRLYDVFAQARARHGCFSFISVYVKAIHSRYLAVGNDGHYSELMAYCGVNPEKMTPALLEEVVSQVDDICIEEKALRYMHSRTVKDPERRRKIDPNALHQPQPSGRPGPSIAPSPTLPAAALPASQA